MRIEPKFIEKNVRLSHVSYYKVGGDALFFTKPETISDLTQSLIWAKENNLPIAIMGEGSNSLFSDDSFKGLIISLGGLRRYFWIHDELLYVESGLSNSEVCEIAYKKSLSDIFWLYKMPGYIGASVRMNARCYGHEMSEFVTHMVTLDDCGKLKTYHAKEIFYGYKKTKLMNSPEIVLGTFLKLSSKKSKKDIRQLMQKCLDDRQKKHHFDFPSCGSTFKNNYSIGIPSGQIFDKLGFKGKRVGNAQVSPYHANFIWNLDNARSADILELASQMKSKVHSELGNDVELEVQPIGKFSEDIYHSCGMDALGRSHKSLEDSDKKFWTGLFYYPKEKKDTQLGEIFNLHYLSLDSSKDYDIRSKLVQLRSLSDALKKPEQAFLKWTVQLKSEDLFLFDKKNSSSTGYSDRLWENSVAEIFFAHPSLEHYCEFECNPHGQWLALEFEKYRKRRYGIEKEKTFFENYWQKNIEYHSDFSDSEKNRLITFGFYFSYLSLKSFIKDDSIRFFTMLSLSLNSKRSLYSAPYAHFKTASKYDFHNINNYIFYKFS